MGSIKPLTFVLAIFSWALIWLGIIYYFSEQKEDEGEL